MQRARADFHELARRGELPAASAEDIAASQAEDVRVRAALSFNKLSCGTMHLLAHDQLQALVALCSAPVVLPPREALSMLVGMAEGSVSAGEVRAALARLTRVPDEARRTPAGSGVALAAPGASGGAVAAAAGAGAVAPDASAAGASAATSSGYAVTNLSAHEMEERAAAAAAVFGTSDGSGATVKGESGSAGEHGSSGKGAPAPKKSIGSVLPSVLRLIKTSRRAAMGCWA